MRLYTCCPTEGCHTFQKALSFLHSYGIEPEINEDETGHYFEFNIPKKFKDRPKFLFEFTQRIDDPICKCGRFLSGKGGNVMSLVDKETDIEICFCLNCLQKGRIVKKEVNEVFKNYHLRYGDD